MIRKTLTIFSMIGLLLSVGLWGVSYFSIVCRSTWGTIALDRGCVHREPSFRTLGFQKAYRRFGKFSFFGAPGGTLEVFTVSRGRLRGQQIVIGEDDWLVLGFLDFETVWKPQFEIFRGSTPKLWYTTVPLWMATSFFATILASIYCVPLHRRRKRQKLGLCLKCGYDLRGSKGRCPECGQEFQKQ